jgi:protein gp37
VDGEPPTSGPGFGVALHEDALMQPHTWSEPRHVLVNTMSDLFHAKVPVDFTRRIFQVMAETPQHTYQVLTKRSKRLVEVAPMLPWPPNVCMGVSIESDRYSYRADHLRGVPAAVRFLQLEPLLGPLPSLQLAEIDWVVVGPEMGSGSRPMATEWVDDLRKRCRHAGVAFLTGSVGRRPLKRPAIGRTVLGAGAQRIV